MRFDLTDLRLFLAVVETGSITRGADRSALALPSASARVKGMEETLGAALLVRRRRGVEPTAAGRALAYHARLVVEQLERMAGELDDHARGLKGEVRLLANGAAISEFLPELLAPWLAEHPNVDVLLEERPSAAIVEAVRGGQADAGIIADWAEASGLALLPFRMDQLVVVVPRRHALAARRSVLFREVLDHDVIGLPEESALQEHLSRHAAAARRRLRLRVRLRSFEAVCRMVGAGAGVGIVPRTAAERFRRSLPIRAVALADPWAERRLGICLRGLEALPPHARRLVEHLARDGAS
ncbi:LysR family transcriptional regulator [Roseomonas terrae]|jgi:DNA-binding transcriptional LysR family regulator|uniref:LysR family transcriptional regulator n=1 Tax=Neoroseomonas terrae TaxID=424799 RepID=A0ABS5EI28_9PROT|nr:LysR family transcriptional regulator [Neoroseomonas terrae]MBR0650641.1 LysR family transcriptional regulator [Neoroseomonas terrae]